MVRKEIFTGAKFEQDGVLFTVVTRSGLGVILSNDETGEVLKKMKYSKLIKFFKAI